MDVTSTLNEINTWPVEQRLQLLEGLWDHIADDGGAPQLTDAQRADLDGRIAWSQSEPNEVVAWDEVKTYLRRPR